jgi:hypothetical protein
MKHQFTLEYWRDGEWFVGRLVEVPGVFSQRLAFDGCAAARGRAALRGGG